MKKISLFLLILFLFLLKPHSLVYAATPTLSPEAITLIKTNIANRISDAMTGLGNTILDSKGINDATINSIMNQSPDRNTQMATNVATAICGAYPNWSDITPDGLEKKAQWHGCVAPYMYSLMLYYQWTGNTNLANLYAYVLTNQLDVLSTPPGGITEFGSNNVSHTLGRTNFSQGYLNDFGMGVISGFGWINQKGVLADTYCVTGETPVDPGKQCKTINLKARIASVLRNILTDTADYKTYRQDPGFLSRSSAGRVVAATVMGVPEPELSKLITESHTNTSNVLCTIMNNNSWKCPTGNEISGLFYAHEGDAYPGITADQFQHLGIILNASGWKLNTNDDLIKKALVFSNNFFSTYFDSTGPMVQTTKDQSTGKILSAGPGYDETNIVNKLGAGAIGNYGTTQGLFKRTNRNDQSGKTVIVGLRGEPAHTAVLSSAFGLEMLLRLAGYPEKADEVLKIADKMSMNLGDYVNNWQDEKSDPGGVLGWTPKTELSIKLARFSFLYYELMGVNQVPYKPVSNPNLPTSTPTMTITPIPPPVPGDLNGDGHVDIFDYNILVADFGKTGSPGFIPADINKDGKVDIFDYNVLVGNFGK